MANDLIPAQRRRMIAKQINECGYASVVELVSKFNVSEMTIHRDLHALMETGQINKTRGGAVSKRDFTLPIAYHSRVEINEKIKDNIAKKAASFIRDEDVVYIDASTTCAFIAKHLENLNHVTVFTNDPMTVLILAECKNICTYSTGGMLSANTMAYVGSIAEEAMIHIKPDKCFIGAAGINLDSGVLDPYYLESNIKRRIVSASNEVFLCASSEKFEQSAQFISTPLDNIDVIITDNRLSSDIIDKLKGKDIKYFTE
jgi:DeoR/GlpR family transcriptional regulator of sugar metabolism